jgi:MoxR-like ATPase
VIIAPHVEDLAVSVLLMTHPAGDRSPELVRRYVRFGASPRGAQSMILTAKARALLAGRYNVSSSDILAVAKPSLRHRLILNFEGEADSVSVDAIVDQVLESVSSERSTSRPNPS